MLYVGVDAHKTTTQITVMEEGGKVIRRRRIASTRADVQEALGGYRRPMKAVLEASYSWGVMYDWLDEIAEDVVLAHPGKVRAIAEARRRAEGHGLHLQVHFAMTNLVTGGDGGERCASSPATPEAGTLTDLCIHPFREDQPVVAPEQIWEDQCVTGLHEQIRQHCQPVGQTADHRRKGGFPALQRGIFLLHLP